MTTKSVSENQKGMKLFLVAGEASADIHAAALLRELLIQDPSLHCYGVGGEALAREGMELVVDARSLNVVGISDWFDKVGEVVGSYRKLCRLIKERRPDCAVLLDLPDFNLRMAKKLKALGVPVVYYISPQVWAWRKYRLKTIQKYVDRMLVVFPFEKEFYLKNGVDVCFVGHPLLESLHRRAGYRSQSEILSGPRVALLPGSRPSELRFHAPLLSRTVEILRARFPGAEFKVPVASTLSLEAVQKALPADGIGLVQGQSREVLEWSDVALVASGTATLETALIGTPFCLFYRTSPSSAWIYHHIARYRGFIGMPNLLHGREVVREFFQEKALPETLAAECIRLVEEEPYRTQQAERLLECRDRLGQPGASARVAKQLFSLLGNRSKTTGLTFDSAPAHT